MIPRPRVPPCPPLRCDSLQIPLFKDDALPTVWLEPRSSQSELTFARKARPLRLFHRSTHRDPLEPEHMDFCFPRALPLANVVPRVRERRLREVTAVTASRRPCSGRYPGGKPYLVDPRKLQVGDRVSVDPYARVHGRVSIVSEGAEISGVTAGIGEREGLQGAQTPIYVKLESSGRQISVPAGAVTKQK
jgi:hypothetical protein